MNTPSDNQDPQTAIDYNLYPSSARPSWLVVPTPENPNVFGRTSDYPQGIKDLAEYVKLHELADRIGDITEDAHGNPKPLSLADRQEAASQLRELGAELAAFHAAMERERKPDWEKWHIDLADSLVHYSGPTPYTLQEAARELRSMATAYTDSKALMDYINENAALADKSSKEWGAAGDKVNEAYRSGMWYAYSDIRNRLPV